MSVSPIDWKMVLSVMDCVMLLIVLVLVALGGRVALHLLSPHPRPSPSTHTSRLALLALLLAGEATLVLYVLSVLTGRVFLLLEFLLMRVMGLFCPLLFVNACIVFCQSRGHLSRYQAESQGSQEPASEEREAGVCEESTVSQAGLDLERQALASPCLSPTLHTDQQDLVSTSASTSLKLPLASTAGNTEVKATAWLLGPESEDCPSCEKDVRGHSHCCKSVPSLSPAETGVLVTGERGGSSSETDLLVAGGRDGLLADTGVLVTGERDELLADTGVLVTGGRDELLADTGVLVTGGRDGVTSETGVLVTGERDELLADTGALVAGASNQVSSKTQGRRAGCVTGVTSCLRAYLWVVAIGVSFISCLHPDVYLCVLPACPPSHPSPSPPSHGAARAQRSQPEASYTALDDRMASNDQRFESSLQSAISHEYITATFVGGLNVSGWREMDVHTPLTTSQLEESLAQSLPSFGLCVRGVFSQVFLYCLFYLLLLLYLALGVLGSPRLTVRDVERDVVWDDPTTSASFFNSGEGSNSNTTRLTLSGKRRVLNLHVPVDVSSLVQSDLKSDSLRHVQETSAERDAIHGPNMLNSRGNLSNEPAALSPERNSSQPPPSECPAGSSGENPMKGLHSQSTAVNTTSSELDRSALDLSQETYPRLKVQTDEPGLMKTSAVAPEHFHLTSEQADTPNVHSEVSRRFKDISSEPCSNPRKSEHWADDQCSDHSTGDDGGCTACHQMTPYVVLAAIVLLAQHVLLLPVWSATVWRTYGQVQVTSPASVFLPTYCAVCFVFWKILKEQGR